MSDWVCLTKQCLALVWACCVSRSLTSSVIPILNFVKIVSNSSIKESVVSYLCFFLGALYK